MRTLPVRTLKFRRSSPRSAYTLLELLIVVALLGLAGALLVPMLGQPDTLRTQAVVRLIIGDISFAQADALAQQEARRIYFYEDGSGYVILQPPYDPEDDFIYDPLAPSGTSGAYIVNFTQNERYSGVSIVEVDIDGGSNFITFDEIGGTITTGNDPGTGGTIVIESLNEKYEITIAPFTGKLTVKRL